MRRIDLQDEVSFMPLTLLMLVLLVGSYALMAALVVFSERIIRPQ